MNSIWLIVIALAVAVTAGFLISLILELKKTLRAVNDFINTTEQSLKPTLEELQHTLRSLRNVSEDINTVTTDVKTLSHSVRDVGQRIQGINSLIEIAASATAIRASGLRAGIKTGIEVLLKNLFSKTGGR
jgi:uncharacterized protein YoxC